MLHVVVLALAVAAAPQEGGGAGTAPMPVSAAAQARSSADTSARGERPVVERPVVERRAARFLARSLSPWSGAPVSSGGAISGAADPAAPNSEGSPPARAPLVAGEASTVRGPEGTEPAGLSPWMASPEAVPADTPAPAGSAASRSGAPADSPGVHRRPRAVQYSDWYGRRLAMHRVMSYALLPLLAAQYYTGTQLMAKGSDAPLWVIRSHAPLATASAVLFGANTVTGIWNLWDARKDPNGRFARTAHGLLMLAADAGFLAAGAVGHPAVQDGSIRSLHRTIAISSMGVALVSYAIMLPPFRR